MYLKRLEIQGFKSFANKTAMEFEPGITAVVGPNGSGKSNVADSVRWVLGEQSTKLLRGKKSEDVVFAGSDKRAKSGVAEVVATFDNQDHAIPLDSAEVSIGRRIDRSGESEYLINGQKVRLMDIVDLVLKSNIGTSRYTVIGQGTIDMLIMSGPAEIKGLLDEASGVKVYQIRRERTLKRLEQTAQNLIRVEDVVAELEPRLKSLRRQAKRMEAREQLETELRVLLREYWGSEHHALSSKLKACVSKQNAINIEKNENSNQISLLEQRRQSLVDKETGSGGKFSEIRQQISKFAEQKNGLLEKKSILSGKISSLKNTPAGNPQLLSLEAEGLKQKLSALTSQLEKDTALHTELTLQENRLEQSVKEVTKKLEDLYSQLSGQKPLDETLVIGSVKEIEGAVEDLLQALENNLQPSEAVGLVKSFQERLQALKSKLVGFFNFGQPDKQNIQELLPQITREKVELEGKFRLVLSERAGLSAGISMKQKQLQELEQKYLDTSLELDKTDLTKIDTLAQDIGDQQQAIEKDLDHISSEVQKLEGLLSSFDLEAKTRREGLSQLEGNLRELQANQDRLQEILSQLQIEGAKIETQLQMLEKEILDFFGENEFSLIRVQAIPATTPELEVKIAKLRSNLEQLGGVDEMTLQEYSETESRYTNLTSQVADLKKGMEDLRKIMDELDEHIHEKFNVAFHKVNEHFEQYFRVLFSGGRANLSLVKNHSELATETEQEVVGEEAPDGLRPEEKLVKKYEEKLDTVVGIDIKATPPGKKLASVQALSGGERALTAIALLCSLLTCFPSPFVVLDEVDAALDEANTVRFGQILGSLAHQTQFVTITHNRETMAQSSTLYGVTMGDDGVSKILSIKFDQATEYAKS